MNFRGTLGRWGCYCIDRGPFDPPGMLRCRDFPVDGMYPESHMDREWLILYDGYCNLCSGTVQWVVRNDRKGRFGFIPLQDERAGRFTAAGAAGEAETVLLVRNTGSGESEVFDRSVAALKIAARLRFPWPLLGIFRLVPRFLRDPVYDFIARNRKRWFGERNTCYIP